MLTLLCELLHLITILDLIDKNLRGFEAWDKVFVDNDGCVTGDVTRNFLFPFLVDETAEAPDVNILAA